MNTSVIYLFIFLQYAFTETRTVCFKIMLGMCLETQPHIVFCNVALTITEGNFENLLNTGEYVCACTRYPRPSFCTCEYALKCRDFHL